MPSVTMLPLPPMPPARARGAREWARGRFEDLQDRVESRPQSAAMWALGIGVIAGVLLGTLITRSGRD